MLILAIETSCDETAISLLEATETPTGTDFVVHKDITRTQIAVHTEFGGVFPGMAKREHQINLPLILEKVMGKEPIPDVVCVTNGPGLEPALWCGIVFAKELGEKWNAPVVPVNHMEGHILSVLVPANPLLMEEGAGGGGKKFSFANDIVFPALALLISGGHTELVLVGAIGDYKIIGKTRDDAVGEAFDKVARMLGIPYPGGPGVSKLAAYARESDTPHHIDLPRPMIHSKDYDFSFSGIKTAVLYHVKDRSTNPRITEAVGLSDEEKQDVAREFENAVAEVLVKKTAHAIEEFEIQTLIVGGGVSANTHIISELKKMIDMKFPDTKFLAPTKELSTDNSLMIALAGYFKIKKAPDAVYDDIRAEGNLPL